MTGLEAEPRQPEQSIRLPGGRPNRPLGVGPASDRPSIVRARSTGCREGGPVLEALDADAVRTWSRAAVAALALHRAEIDALNVFPVPDSDTGSNLLTTLRAADAALSDSAAP